MKHKKETTCGLLIQDPDLFIDSGTVREVRVNAPAAQYRFIELCVQPVHPAGDTVTASTRRIPNSKADQREADPPVVGVLCFGYRVARSGFNLSVCGIGRGLLSAPKITPGSAGIPACNPARIFTIVCDLRS